MEHYEIACYGTLRTFAEHLGNSEVVNVLEQSLEEEKQTDKMLTRITVPNFRLALQCDPNHLEANLLLGACLKGEEARPYLEKVIRYAAPDSFDYAHAKKLLAGEKWTFEELCERVGPDGVIR